MAASLKYFGLRLVNAAVVLFIVIFMITAAFSTLADQQLETQIDEQIRGRAASMAQDTNMNQTELNQWMEDEKTRLREKFELDEPLWKRIIKRTFDTYTLDFGTSFTQTGPEGSREVINIIWSVLPRTILLFTTAATLYILLGLFVGLKAAQVAGSKMDKILSIFGITMSSMPMWWLAMLAILIFSYQLNWFPASAYPFPNPEEVGTFEYYGTILYRMILPLSVITFNIFGARAWVTRNLVTGVLQDDYIMAARAKGVPERKVIYGHTLKTAAPPIVTSAILAFLMSIGGAIITEVIFNWPGMGRLLWSSIQMNDTPVILGIVFISTFMYVIGYVIADMIYGLLDPRVEVGAGSSVR